MFKKEIVTTETIIFLFYDFDIQYIISNLVR